MTRRYALYWLPAPGSGLAAFGNAVLGYDNVAGAPVPHPDGLGDLAAVTAGARIYGFHATLKAPMRLAPAAEEADLLATARDLAAGTRRFRSARCGSRRSGRSSPWCPKPRRRSSACSPPNASPPSIRCGRRSRRPSAPSAARSASIRRAARSWPAGATRMSSRPSGST